MVQPSVTNDVHTMMLFEANKKSAGIAYLLWFLIGALGAHRFYLGDKTNGICLAVLTVFAAIFWGRPAGSFLMLAIALWLLVDAFCIPGWVRRYNMELVTRLTGGANIRS
jgi:TM2 domain-containing membrane protein YozV